MSDSSGNKIKIKLVGEGDEKWPMLEILWDFFSEKGVKTVFMSVGSDSNPHADLEIAETLGCPLHVFEVRDSVVKNWESVQTVLKSRKPLEQSNDFLTNVEKKWVLPKNIRIHKELPAPFTGTAVLDGTSYPTKDIFSCVQDCISTMSLKEDQIRIDILKISLGNAYEIPILQAVLTSGFRPGMILMNWSNLPDENLASCITAGHLQTCGYTLFAHYGNHFIYISNDRCMYEICSWQVNTIDNPMISEIVKDCLKPSRQNVTPN